MIPISAPEHATPNYASDFLFPKTKSTTLPLSPSARGCGSPLPLPLQRLLAPIDPVSDDDGASHWTPCPVRAPVMRDLTNTVKLPVNHSQLPGYISTDISTNHVDQPGSATANARWAIAVVKYSIRLRLSLFMVKRVVGPDRI